MKSYFSIVLTALSMVFLIDSTRDSWRMGILTRVDSTRDIADFKADSLKTLIDFWWQFQKKKIFVGGIFHLPNACSFSHQFFVWSDKWWKTNVKIFGFIVHHQKESRSTSSFESFFNKLSCCSTKRRREIISFSFLNSWRCQCIVDDKLDWCCHYAFQWTFF